MIFLWRPALALLAGTLAGTASAGQVTDSAGRIVTVRDPIERVFASGPPASILVYGLAPEKLTGWPGAASEPCSRRTITTTPSFAAADRV